MSRQFFIDSIREFLADIDAKDSAKLAQSNIAPNMKVMLHTFDLSTARDVNDPFEIGFPFKSFLIREASDSNAYINFAFDSRGTARQSAKVQKNSVFTRQYPMARGFFWWPAQSGKTLTIELYSDSEIFPGNQSVSFSSVFSSAEIPNAVSTVTNAAAVLLAADLDRKRSIIQNQGGIDILVGGPTVTGRAGARPGIIILPGESFIYDNTAALYAITDAGSNANIAIQTFK